MKIENPSLQLRERIKYLENKQAEEAHYLKTELNAAFESLKPVNFIKNIFHELFSPPDGKNDIVNSVVGMISGFIARKFIVGKSKNPFKKLAAGFAQIAISNGLSKNADSILDKGIGLLKKIIPSKKKRKYAYTSENENLVTNS